MFDVAGKKVLVTGSTQGIGKEIATAFAKAGASVWIHGSRQEKTERVSGEIGLGTRPAWADLSADGCAESLYAQTGDVDILILNASVQYRKAWAEITPQEFETQMHVNLRSTLELIRNMHLPCRKRTGGGLLRSEVYSRRFRIRIWLSMPHQNPASIRWLEIWQSSLPPME